MSMFTDKKIAFLGAGKMAEAIIGGLIGQGLVKPYQIVGIDVAEDRLAYMAETYGIETAVSQQGMQLIDDIIVLSVKPQLFPHIKFSHPRNAMFISIMAGVTVDQIKAKGSIHEIVRSMPNTPAMVREGMTVWTATDTVSDAKKAQAQAIFEAVGEQVYVHDEKYIDMATAINGSGPAYVFLMMEAMVDAAVQMGLARDVSEKLVMQTFAGSTKYAQQSDQPLVTLRNSVTSPGGTTAAALYAMEKGGLRTAIADGVLGAYKRAGDLGK